MLFRLSCRNLLAMAFFATSSFNAAILSLTFARRTLVGEFVLLGASTFRTGWSFFSGDDRDCSFEGWSICLPSGLVNLLLVVLGRGVLDVADFRWKEKSSEFSGTAFRLSSSSLALSFLFEPGFKEFTMSCDSVTAPSGSSCGLDAFCKSELTRRFLLVSRLVLFTIASSSSVVDDPLSASGRRGSNLIGSGTSKCATGGGPRSGDSEASASSPTRLCISCPSSVLRG